MCSIRPLNYDSLKKVIQWIDPNLRFTLSQRLQSIQAAERGTPLQLKNLFLGPNEITVNDTVYSLKLIVTGEDAEQMMRNDPEGFPHDLTKSGVRDYSSEGIMTPGDIKIVGEDTEKHKNVVKEHIKNDMRNFEANLDNLDDYDCEYFMKFTISNDSEVQRIEYLKTDKKLYEAMKFLTTKLLGKRCTVGVDNLKIFEEEDCILRLPQDLNIATQSVVLGHNSSEVFNSIAPIIDKKSFPLQTVFIKGMRIHGDMEKYSHPLIKSAVEVCFDEFTSRESEAFNWVEAISSMENKTIHFGCTFEFTNEDYMRVINDLVKNRRPLGTHLMFDSHEEDQVEDVFYDIADRDECDYLKLENVVYSAFDYCIILPMDNSKKLKVYVNNDFFDCNGGYTLNFLVIDNEEFDRLEVEDQKIRDRRADYDAQ